MVHLELFDVGWKYQLHLEFERESRSSIVDFWTLVLRR